MLCLSRAPPHHVHAGQPHGKNSNIGYGHKAGAARPADWLAGVRPVGRPYRARWLMNAKRVGASRRPRMHSRTGAENPGFWGNSSSETAIRDIRSGSPAGKISL